MIKLGKVFDVPIILASELLIFITVFCGITLFQSGIHSALMSLLAIVVVAFCITSHEVGHLIAGKYCGVRVNNITLNYMGGVASTNSDDWQKLMDQPKKAIIIWICGPLVNIGFMILLTIAMFGVSDISTVVPSHFNFLSKTIGALSWVRTINLVMAVFNLLPLYPLDGGGIFYSICRLYTNKLKAIKIATIVSMIGFVILFIVAIKYRAIIPAIIAVFLFFHAKDAPRSALFS